MSDNLTKAQRSRLMARVASKGNRTTERKLRAKLVSAGISGWKINAAAVRGKPDFVFENLGVAIFVDGCFWHGCIKCRSIPKANHKFWVQRIEGNKTRDRQITYQLRHEGWKVLRIWEHDLQKRPGSVMARIAQAIRPRDQE